VSADGRGLVSQAGAVLLWETIRVTGLGWGLSAGLKRWRAPRAVHDPGKIIADLAAALALRQRPRANPPPAGTAGLSMLIAWCMGVTQPVTIDKGWQNGRSRSGTQISSGVNGSLGNGCPV
jgi:hypothetical protein